MNWPDVTSIAEITEHQKEKLIQCLRGLICLLGGSPGTGKTFTAAALIKAISKTYGLDRIAVAAPTGKAAVRISQAMQANGIDIKARTWHSLLGMGVSEGGFLHDETNPLEYSLIIGDESSMIDTDLMASILRAIPECCKLLLVGDVNQLPPVGHGAPLRDMIAAGVPYGELREIKRNSGGIVEACASIRDGHPWEPGDNLIYIPESRPEHQLGKMMERISLAKLSGLNPVWDCQVLVAVNEKSPLSRKTVNQYLQSELNNNVKIEGTIFRISDKVVCLKNSNFTLLKDSTAGSEGDQIRIMNGELGKVIEVAPKYLAIEMELPSRVIRVPRSKEEGSEGAGCNFDLGYALSVHKSQGSEWPVSIVMIDEYPGAKMVCSREWIYTAISRAKKECVLIGKKSTIDQMTRKVSINQRRTFLKERILQNISKLEMAGM